jgi:hypothetical protein
MIAGRHTHPGEEVGYDGKAERAVKLLATHIVEKGKPLATLAP